MSQHLDFSINLRVGVCREGKRARKGGKGPLTSWCVISTVHIISKELASLSRGRVSIEFFGPVQLECNSDDFEAQHKTDVVLFNFRWVFSSSAIEGMGRNIALSKLWKLVKWISVSWKQ